MPLGGVSVPASYIVTNNTSSERKDNFVKYFAPNVDQVITGAIGECAATFTLAKKGNPGDSCILQLLVNGSVNGRAPDPRNHLFVCAPGGISCAGTEYPLNVMKSPLAIAAGGYSDMGGNSYLLLAMSASGEGWSYPIDSLTSPLDFGSSSGFNSSSCSDNNAVCIAGGSYVTHSTGVAYPVLAATLDKGKTWTYKVQSTSKFPEDFFQAGQFGFASVDCDGTLCVAGGSYQVNTTPPPFEVPFLMVSDDGAKTWTTKMDSTTPQLPSGFGYSGAITGVSCKGKICAAVGSYLNLSFFDYPLLASSTDGGKNWQYKIDSTNPPPSLYDFGGFSGVSCSDKGCVSIGGYNSSPDSLKLTFLLAHTANGTHWSYKQINNVPTIFAQGSLSAVSCDNNLCITAGFNEDSSLTQYPLLARSQDGGNTWFYINLTSSQLPGDFTFGVLANVSCDNMICAAGGSYTNVTSGFGNQFPLLLVTRDGGKTWSSVIDSSNVPADFDYGHGNSSQGQVNGVSCSNGVCAASGQYRSTKPGTYFPFLATPVGSTWVYQIQDTGPNPSDLYTGTFASASMPQKQVMKIRSAR